MTFALVQMDDARNVRDVVNGRARRERVSERVRLAALGCAFAALARGETRWRSVNAGWSSIADECNRRRGSGYRA